MENAIIQPSPPDLNGLVWRAVTINDLAALVELAHTCHSVDGGLSFLNAAEPLVERYFPDAPGSCIGAFTADERLAACAAVYLSSEPGIQRATIVGRVRPDLRNRGIGAYLMRWSQAQAEVILADAAKPWVLRVATEALSETADQLYKSFGFEHVFESLVMRRELDLPMEDFPFADGVSITSWQPELAGRFFQAYHAAFRERPGFPGWNEAEWTAQVTEDDPQNHHKPEWSLLASAADEPIGFLIGDIDLTTVPPGGFVWQVGVIPGQRRRGLGSALITETMRRMQADGAAAVQLTVNVNNPGAIVAYTRLGFSIVGRRARYERILGAGADA